MSDNNVTKLLRALVGPGQSVEDALQQLYSERRIDTAIGEQLDIVGRVVGQDRNGMNDTDYRRMINARISVNRSRGTIADVIVVGKLVLNVPAATRRIDNSGIASLVYYIENVISDWKVCEQVIKMLRDTVSGGVRIILEFWLATRTDLFNFNTFVAGSSVGKGWGSTLSATVGGKLASALE